jgi:hypothetical protein
MNISDACCERRLAGGLLPLTLALARQPAGARRSPMIQAVRRLTSATPVCAARARLFRPFPSALQTGRRATRAPSVADRGGYRDHAVAAAQRLGSTYTRSSESDITIFRHALYA